MAPTRPRRTRPTQRRGGSRAGPSVDMSPRVIDVAPAIRRQLRYSGFVTSTAQVNVTRASLLSMLVSSPGAPSSGGAAATVVYTPLFESVRIRNITVTMPAVTGPSTTDPFQSLTFEWLSYLGRNVRLTKTVTSSLGTRFTTTPPRDSRAALWSSANISANAVSSVEEILFTISHTPDSQTASASISLLVDIDFDAVVSNDTQSTITAQYAAITNTLNAGIFALPLDAINANLTMASNRLNPVGYPDYRIDSTGAALLPTALVRLN